MGLLGRLVKVADVLTNSWTTRVAANHFLERYGKVLVLKIDRTGKSIELEMQLHGESEPVAVHVGSYEFDAGNPGKIALKGVTVSKAWMDQLAKDFVEGKSLAVPGEIGKYLAMVL